jgi:hypothetical protein
MRSIGLVVVLSARAWAAMLFCVVGDGALAYNEDGHYYTIAALQQERRIIPPGIPPEQLAVVSLCAQIPDLSRELDATTLKVNSLGTFGGWLWAGFSACRGSDVRNMNEVHHYLHALTDGASNKVDEAAHAILRRLHVAWLADRSDASACALGLGIHHLGDAHSHRRLTNESRMYAPGMGHYSDDHDPDYIVFPRRQPLWERYVGTLGSALDIAAHAEQRAVFLKITQSRTTGGSRDNAYYTQEIIKEMAALKPPNGGTTLPAWPAGVPAVDRYYEQASWFRRKVLDGSFDEVMRAYIPTQAAQATFADVWPKYRAIAREEYRNVRHLAVCDRD